MLAFAIVRDSIHDVLGSVGKFTIAPKDKKGGTSNLRHKGASPPWGMLLNLLNNSKFIKHASLLNCKFIKHASLLNMQAY